MEKAPKPKCPWCGRNIGVYFPRGGDGSAVMFRKHNDWPWLGVSCRGSDELIEIGKAFASPVDITKGE